MAAALNQTTLVHVLQHQYNESVTTVPNPNYMFQQSPAMTGPPHVMRQQQQQQLYPEPSLQKPYYGSSSWIDPQGQTAHQSNNYNGGVVQPRLVRDNQYRHVHRSEEYESLASENSPTRPAGYVQGRNQQPQGQHPTNPGQFHGYRDNTGWRRDRRY